MAQSQSNLSEWLKKKIRDALEARRSNRATASSGWRLLGRHRVRRLIARRAEQLSAAIQIGETKLADMKAQRDALMLKIRVTPPNPASA